MHAFLTSSNIRPKVNFTIKFPQKKISQFIDFINKYVCYNQGRYIEFEYLLSQRHMELKKEINKKPIDPNGVMNACMELLRFTTSELKRISDQNFRYMLEYFDIIGKHQYQPRVCVKGISGNNITDLFRNHRGSYYSKRHPIESNTGHEYVRENGLWYIENDIPSKAKMGIYRNPRLINNLVREYSRPFYTYLKKQEPDHRWIGCWETNDNGSPAAIESCYKSTMIIPMTLKYSESLSDEFIRTFFENQQDSADRTIWGFVCFDHITTNYFDKNLDRKMGYIFADILSLYYIATFIHIHNSITFHKATEFIGKKPEEWGELLCHIKNPKQLSHHNPIQKVIAQKKP